MEPAKHIQQDGKLPSNPIRVWDLPTRLFHWLLVILVIISFVTAAIGGLAMQYHKLSGYTILTLLLFRVTWGFVGGRQSRFASFVRGPSAVRRYAASLIGPDHPSYLGHNPLGGWSVIAMLLALFIQVGTGLFANDKILTEGPLYAWVSNQTSDWLTRIHKINQQTLVLLVVVHVSAILFYLLFKRENFLRPMITGIKQWSGDAAEPVDGRPWMAAVIAALAAVAVYLLVRPGSL